MIMRGNTPHSLTWPGCFAVVALGLTFLPMLPALHGEPPRKEEDASKAEMEAAKARLEEAKVNLKQQQAMLQLAEAKLKAAEAQAREFEKQARCRANRLESAKKDQAGKAPGERKARYRIEITFPTDKLAANPNEIIDKIAKSLPKGCKIVFSRPHPVPALPVRQSDEKRINDLEKKLEKVLHELHELRKQLKESRSGTSATPPPSLNPRKNPSLKNPYYAPTVPLKPAPADPARR